MTKITHPKLKKKNEWRKALQEAQKDPSFKKEIKAFIKATSKVHNLKDYGLENL